MVIFTKTLGETNTKPRRIKARTSSGRTLTLSNYDPKIEDLDYEAKHKAVARMLCRSLGWKTRLVGAEAKAGEFCFILK